MKAQTPMTPNRPDRFFDLAATSYLDALEETNARGLVR